MVPGGVELFAFEAALFRSVLFEEIERQAPQRGQVGGRVPRSCPTAIFAALHVQNPVQ